MSEKYDDEFLISELQRFYIENTKVPTMKDFQLNKDFPSECTYKLHFGTWNNALRLAGLIPNQIHNKLIGNECCEICKSNNTPIWYYKNNKRICQKCYTDRNYFYGVLNVTSSTAIGVITEHVVYKVLNDCVKCNTRDNFNADYDLISNKYKIINVKSAKLHETNNVWLFTKRINSKIPNNYICLGFDKNRIKILKVWIVPENSALITKHGIFISCSEKGLKRAKQYEVDATLYNEVYQNLDIYTLPEFRNLNKTEEVSV